MKSVVKINFTSGVGNNIFQYVFARLFAENHGFELSYPALYSLNLEGRNIPFNPDKPIIDVIGSSKNPIDYNALLSEQQKDCNYNLKIYPEDYTLYTPVRERIKGWFPWVSDSIPNDDLVFHLRLGDRLIMKSTFKPENYLPLKAYSEAIGSVKFNRLHIVTDMPVWKKILPNDVALFIFHRGVNKEDRIDPKTSADHFNSLVDGFSKYDPVVRAGYMVEEDFNYMRSANKLMFQHGTLSWWAGFLGEAEEVYLYGKWRDKKNINLGWTDLPGWKQWGDLTAPPRQVKVDHLRGLAKEYGFKKFVETGTRGGSMLVSLADLFEEMHSVEIIPEAVEKVRRKLRTYKNIKLYLGDSAVVLPDIMKRINEPSLFWLDAHADRDATPIMQELHTLLPTVHKHVIVIDDYRYFGTEKAYPSIKDVAELVYQKQPSAKVDIKFDSIRIFC